MKREVATNYDELTLSIVIKSNVDQKLFLTVYDKELETRMFTNRYKTVNGEITLLCPMPLSPKTVVVYLRGESKKDDGTFELVSVRKIPLQKKIDVVDIKPASLQDWIVFSQKVAYNFPELKAGTVYASEAGNYFIKISKTLADGTGKEVNTPARIGTKTGVIELSQKRLMGQTVPMVFALLCHEYSHFYINRIMEDEVEADMNGLLLYLALGYPRIEAYQAFLKAFIGRPTQQNAERTQKIKQFIDNFDSVKSVIKYG